MQNYLDDRLQITDLLTGWMHRDLGEWEQLRNLFTRTAPLKSRGLRASPAISLRAQYGWERQMCAPSI